MEQRLKAGIFCLLLVAVFFVILFPAPVSGQTQPKSNDLRYISRYDFFNGFSYMATPDMNLYERGYNVEFGVNLNKWLALGGDYSILTGNSSIWPSQLTTTIQKELAPLAPLLPPGYKLYIPYSATTQTYSAGPQINFRQWKPVTFFVRPALGGLHQGITLKPTDPIQSTVVSLLVPSKQKSDNVLFYGVGGGLDFNISDHWAIRTAADYVHYFVFDGTLANASNTVRLSVGPTFRFGRNVNK